MTVTIENNIVTVIVETIDGQRVTTTDQSIFSKAFAVELKKMQRSVKRGQL